MSRSPTFTVDVPFSCSPKVSLSPLALDRRSPKPLEHSSSEGRSSDSAVRPPTFSVSCSSVTSSAVGNGRVVLEDSDTCLLFLVSSVHERGTFIGIATVALINGPHVASLRKLLDFAVEA